MQKIKIVIIIIIFLSIVFNLSAQIIVEAKPNKTKYAKLENDRTVFYVKKDSILQNSSQIKSFDEFLFVGKCNGWTEGSCGLVNLALFAEKTAKTRGYDAGSVNYYRGTSNKGTLSITFYRLSDEKIVALQDEGNRTKYLSLINPKNSADTDVKVEGDSLNLYVGTYLLMEVKKYDIPFKLGKGFFNSRSINLSFKKGNSRYFLVNRYKLTGSPTSNEKSMDVGQPKLMEVGQLAGEIMMEFLTRLGTGE